MAIKNTVSCDFYPHSSIFTSVFDCRLSGMRLMLLFASSYSLIKKVLYKINSNLIHKMICFNINDKTMNVLLVFAKSLPRLTKISHLF